MALPIQTGETVPAVAQATITREALRAYAEASGDHNPIHLDEEVAKKMGLPGIIAHGMLTAAFVAERARRFMDEKGLAGSYVLESYQNRFRAMTLVGDLISIGGTVKEASDSRVVLDLQARNQRGETTTTGQARFVKKG